MGKKLELKGKRFGKLLVLEETEKRSGTCVVWKCICDCGNITFVSSQNLTKKNGTKSCGCLQKKKAKEKVKDITGEKFGKLTAIRDTGKRTDGGAVWLCKCDCGNMVEVSKHSLSKKKGGRKSCGCLLKESSKKSAAKRILDLSGKTFGELKVLEIDKERNEGRVSWICQCSCGNIKSINSDKLVSGEYISCGCIKSKGERKIKEILKENGINFEYQKVFETCIFKDTNYPARFDFYVENSYIIEYDGEQHFKFGNIYWNTEEVYKKRKEKDEYKNEWCKENGIPLIRIPYTRYKYIKMEDLTPSTSKFLVNQ